MSHLLRFLICGLLLVEQPLGLLQPLLQLEQLLPQLLPPGLLRRRENLQRLHTLVGVADWRVCRLLYVRNKRVLQVSDCLCHACAHMCRMVSRLCIVCVVFAFRVGDARVTRVSCSCYARAMLVSHWVRQVGIVDGQTHVWAQRP